MLNKFLLQYLKLYVSVLISLMFKKTRKFILFIYMLCFPINGEIISYANNITAKTTSVSVFALTWNMGNTSASNTVINSLAQEIQKTSYPDIIVIGTQEELAKEGSKFKDKLLFVLNNEHGMKYVAHNENYKYEISYKTFAGANNSVKTAALSGLQKTPLSSGLGLAQNRTTLCMLVKEGVIVKDLEAKIYYPPDSKNSNNAFIVLKGSLIKNTPNGPAIMPFNFANVHLNSSSDRIRRAHANVFFEGEGLSDLPKSYGQIAQEANHFYLIMGDFNERDYLMKNNAVTDRGHLTNFVGFGFDFFQHQGINQLTYGTYGFTKLNNNSPQVASDPRGRLHNAKGGFLDRITYNSGLSVESAPLNYGAIINPDEFNIKSKIFYAGSDHLPVMRHFKINVNESVNPGIADYLDAVRAYLKRRVPNFEYEIKDLQHLKGGLLTDDHFKFYDTVSTPNNRVSAGIDEKLNELITLQNQLKQLCQLIENSTNNQFLEEVYNKMTSCNIHRNNYLEHVDDPEINWFVPASLSYETLNLYKVVVEGLLQKALI